VALDHGQEQPKTPMPCLSALLRALVAFAGPRKKWIGMGFALASATLLAGYLEPAYDYSFAGEHPQFIGISAGVLIANIQPAADVPATQVSAIVLSLSSLPSARTRS
jgi:hypothetical protein